MTSRNPGQSRSRQAIQALLKLREIQNDDAGLKVRQKQAEITRSEQEIARLRSRRDNVIRRGGERVLEERLLLDALMKLLLRRKEEHARLCEEAEVLMQRYLEATSKRDAVRSLESREARRTGAVRDRRKEQIAGDQAAARRLLDRVGPGEEPCAD